MASVILRMIVDTEIFNNKMARVMPNGIKLSGQMPKTSLILKSERSFYFSH